MTSNIKPMQRARAWHGKLAVALQGGGSHGAFAWGVLDTLLKDRWIHIDTVIGTSAGAMNAVVLADGLLRGREEARNRLRDFWTEVGKLPGLASMFAPMAGRFGQAWHLDDSPAYVLFDMMSRVYSPYDLNPLGYHPLRAVLADAVDFSALQQQNRIRVMVCATNVRTGRRRVFANHEISIDAVLASACLPFLFPAVEIEGEAYWDGGYTGNPPIGPVLREGRVTDLMIVGINPLVREEVPKSARDIINRVNEISFNSTFWLELTAIGLMKILRDEGVLDAQRVPLLHFHAIDAGAVLGHLGASSKMNNSPLFLEHLFGMGKQEGEAWLAANRDVLGHDSTVDLRELLPPGIVESVQ